MVIESMYTSTTTMKILLILLLSAVSAMAQVVTIGLSGTGTNNYADLIVEPYQTAELLSISPLSGSSLSLEKDGVASTEDFYSNQSGSTWQFHPVVVQGPALIRLRRNRFALDSLATFRLMPEPYPVGSALLVPPGPGGASVVLQCSTNLVDWSSATNGAYTGLPVAKFFRIRLDKIQATP